MMQRLTNRSRNDDERQESTARKTRTVDRIMLLVVTQAC